MIIRQQQMQSFEEIRMPEFEEFMLSHLRDFSPLHAESLGEPGMRTLIRAGMERAEKHAFSQRATVKFYIEMMILLGVDFDTDPQYPWPRAILADSSISDEVDRADRLHNWLMDLLRSAAGEDRAYARQALVRARQIPFQPISVAQPNFTSESIRRMKENHPEKVAYVGEDNLKGLIPRAKEDAAQFGVATDAGVCLFLGLMFAVGHGFTRDPKYPWVAHTLMNAAITDPNKRVERLYSKTMTYLDFVLKHLKGQA